MLFPTIKVKVINCSRLLLVMPVITVILVILDIVVIGY